jgi:hypothetical protein
MALICVLKCCTLLLYWMKSVECLDGWSGGGWGVFIALTHQNNHWGRLLSMGAPDSRVRQPRHSIVRVLTQSTIGALTSGGTGQSSATPDRHCSLSGAPLTTALTSAANCSAVRGTVQSTVAPKSRCSAVTPDSLMAHRTVRWIITERRLRNPKVKSSKLYGPGAPDTIRWHTEQSGAPDQGTLRFLLLLSFWTLIWSFYWFVLNLYAPVGYII